MCTGYSIRGLPNEVVGPPLICLYSRGQEVLIQALLLYAYNYILAASIVKPNTFGIKEKTLTFCGHVFDPLSGTVGRKVRVLHKFVKPMSIAKKNCQKTPTFSLNVHKRRFVEVQDFYTCLQTVGVF